MSYMMSPYMPNAYPANQNYSQARLNQMEQQYPQFAMQQPMQQQMVQQPVQQTQQMVNARMVTSKEEALGVPVDFSGALMVFTDVSHGKIYTKAFNTGTGSADIHTYDLDNTPETTSSVLDSSEYVTRKEYNELLEIITGGTSNADKPNNDSNKVNGSQKSTNGSGSESGSKNAGRQNS